MNPLEQNNKIPIDASPSFNEQTPGGLLALPSDVLIHIVVLSQNYCILRACRKLWSLSLNDSLWSSILRYNYAGGNDSNQRNDSISRSSKHQLQVCASKVRGWTCNKPFVELYHLPGVTELLCTMFVGNGVICGSRNTRVSYVDPEDVEQTQSIAAHADCVTSLLCINDQHIGSASNDGTLQYWRLPCSQTNWKLEHLPLLDDSSHSRAITDSLALSPRHNNNALTSSKDGRVKLWGGPSERRVVHTFDAGEIGAQYNMAAVGADERQFVVGGYDGHLRVWDIASGKLLSNRGDMCDWITEVQSDADHNRYFVSDRSGLLRGFDERTYEPCLFMKASKVPLGHRWSVTSFRLLGNTIVCGRSDGLLLYDIRKSTRSLSWLGARQQPVAHVRVSSGDHWGPQTIFASHSSSSANNGDNSLETFRVNRLAGSEQPADTAQVLRGYPSQFSVSADCQRVAVALYRGGLQILEPPEPGTLTT